jgi:hypothetical protein
MRTLEGLLAGVRVDVVVQLGASDESLATVAAGQLALRLVVLHVIVQAVLKKNSSQISCYGSRKKNYGLISVVKILCFLCSGLDTKILVFSSP